MKPCYHLVTGMGGLALSVVNVDTLLGKTANLFLINNAGKVISNDELAQIGLELMHEDFSERYRSLAASNGELSWQQIQAYHNSVFSRHRIAEDAWTPNIVLDLITDPTEKSNYWDRMLRIDALDPVLAYIDLVYEVLSNDQDPVVTGLGLVGRH